MPFLHPEPHSKDYFDFKIATPRAFIEPSFADKFIIPHSEYLKKAKVVVGVAKALKDNEVELEDGTTVPFDYLILATGSKINPAFNHPTKDDRVKFFQDRECCFVPVAWDLVMCSRALYRSKCLTEIPHLVVLA